MYLAYSPPPSRRRLSFQLVSEPGYLIIRLYRLEIKMSFRELVHNPTYIFDGTNYDVQKIRMLNIIRDMDPNLERIVEVFLLQRIPKNYL